MADPKSTPDLNKGLRVIIGITKVVTFFYLYIDHQSIFLIMEHGNDEYDVLFDSSCVHMAKVQPTAFSPNAKWNANFKMKQFHLKLRLYGKNCTWCMHIFAPGCIIYA